MSLLQQRRIAPMQHAKAAAMHHGVEHNHHEIEHKFEVCAQKTCYAQPFSGLTRWFRLCVATDGQALRYGAFVRVHLTSACLTRRVADSCTDAASASKRTSAAGTNGAHSRF